MTNQEIRDAAAADLAADEAAQLWVLTDEMAEEWPHLASQLLRRLDVYCGGWRMAPLTSRNGQAVADTMRSFKCFPDDVREAAI